MLRKGGLATAFLAALGMWIGAGPALAEGPNVAWTPSASNADNPLTEDGLLYYIKLAMADGVKWRRDEVILAHVEIGVEIECKHGTIQFTLDYWEAFTIQEDGTAGADTHSVDRGELLEYAQKAKLFTCGCCDLVRMVVTRKHTISLGTVEDAPWFDNGGANDKFAYLLLNPEGKRVTPDKRPEKVRGKVTGFKKEGAITFTGTYTWTASGGSTYESSLGKTYKLGP